MNLETAVVARTLVGLLNQHEREAVALELAKTSETRNGNQLKASRRRDTSTREAGKVHR